MNVTIRCAKMVYSSGMFHGTMCSRAGTIERDGKLWCKQHDPERVAARRAAQAAKWDAEHQAQREVEAEAMSLAKALGVGRPEYSTLSGKGCYTGGIVLTAEEAQRVIGWLEALRRER